MAFSPLKSRSRRAQIREGRSDTLAHSWDRLTKSDIFPSLLIATCFWAGIVAILGMRDTVLPYRPGQAVPYDIVSRVNFVYHDDEKLNAERTAASEHEPRVFIANGDVWGDLQTQLLTLPEKASVDNPALLAEPLRSILDAGSITALRQLNTPERRASFSDNVRGVVRDLQKIKTEPGPLIIVPDEDRASYVHSSQLLRIAGVGVIRADEAYSPRTREFRTMVENVVQANFGASLSLQPKIVDAVIALIKPTHVYDAAATSDASNTARANVPLAAGNVVYKATQVLVDKKLRAKSGSGFTQSDWLLLRAENEEYRRTLGRTGIKGALGVMLTSLLITIIFSGYVASFQPRVVQNHARAMAIVVLLLSTLLLAQLAGVGSYQLYLLGTAPTLLVAMISTIAYDKRFSLGLATGHAVLVTIGLDQNAGFFVILWTGSMAAAFLLDDIRTRSKLIEVGGLTAIVLILSTMAQGFLALQPVAYVFTNCLHAGAGGLAAGFIVLGILPFIEKAFRITTSMTLLELADASHPLLRRLAIEAPGTYNHSLQVATLSESAAEAIGANSLLCRVASYYHDVGKVQKPDYFVENQANGQNRHINLSPSVSLLIIVGHVKDGVELAREYNLPTSVHAFIQQHHGTTLVEFFYHQACSREQVEGQATSEEQYRYPGPKPRSKEVALVMLADCVESACRAMPEPTASRVETLVHDLALKRLLDGQFDECDLTIRDLEMAERAMVKTLLGIYHGRIAYPSTGAIQTGSVKTA